MKTIDYAYTAKQIRAELKAYLEKYNLKALVIGESGGIDSALCTVLANPVCNELGVELIGRSITIETNKPDEIQRGKDIGNLFCTNFKEIDLTQNYLQMRDSIEEEVEQTYVKRNIRRGNIKARIRMIYLYNLAQLHEGLVLSTDNYTEYLEGFWTLHGDVGDYGMIQELWKTEVYGLSQWLVDNELQTKEEKAALAACIDAIPTDGLGISNSDLDQLGVKTYYEVDKILQEYINKGAHADNPVVKRHLSSKFKRNNPFNLKRSQITC
jgi:NAD+ synthase